MDYRHTIVFEFNHSIRPKIYGAGLRFFRRNEAANSRC